MCFEAPAFYVQAYRCVCQKVKVKVNVLCPTKKNFLKIVAPFQEGNRRFSDRRRRCFYEPVIAMQRCLAGRTGGRVNSLSFFLPYLFVQKGTRCSPYIDNGEPRGSCECRISGSTFEMVKLGKG